jgi:hypothetical protein
VKAGTIAAAAVSLAVSMSAARPAQARVTQDERYSFDVTWNTAVRLIRVDFGFAITERDRETGFVMFNYVEQGRSTPGSIELVHARVEGVDGCRVVITLPQMPQYVERLIASRLARKLRDEYGEPPSAPRPAPPQPTQPPANGDRDGDRPHDGAREGERDRDRDRDGSSHAP